MNLTTASINKIVKSLLGRIAFNTRLHVLTLREVVPVLAFHRISKDPSDEDSLTYGLEDFENLCAFLSRYFHVVPLGHILKKLEDGASFDRELAITFDDGYRDNHDLAAPVLKERNLPATFFVTTRYIGTEHVPWWYAKQRVHREWMNWEQVESLHRMGFEIGSHTMTHIDLGSASEEDALRELVNSRTELEQRLSSPVTLFAYPYGWEDKITEQNRELVKLAGYSCCCSCFGGLNAKGTDPFHLRRIPISNWYRSPHDFGFQLAMHRV